MRRKAKGSEAVTDFSRQVNEHGCYRYRDASGRSPMPLGSWDRKHFLKILFLSTDYASEAMGLKCVLSSPCDHV